MSFAIATLWTQWPCYPTNHSVILYCFFSKYFIRRDSMKFSSQIWFIQYFAECISASITWLNLLKMVVYTFYLCILAPDTVPCTVGSLLVSIVTHCNKLPSNSGGMWGQELFSCSHHMSTVDQLGLCSEFYLIWNQNRGAVFIRNAAGLVAEGKGTMLNHRLALKASALKRQLLPLASHCQSK